MIRTKRTYLLPTSNPITVFLIAESMTFSLYNVLQKIKRNGMSELFCIANLLEVGRKETLFKKFYGF